MFETIDECIFARDRKWGMVVMGAAYRVVYRPFTDRCTIGHAMEAHLSGICL
jgi:hypothetical protein